MVEVLSMKPKGFFSDLSAARAGTATGTAARAVAPASHWRRVTSAVMAVAPEQGVRKPFYEATGKRRGCKIASVGTAIACDSADTQRADQFRRFACSRSTIDGL